MMKQWRIKTYEMLKNYTNAQPKRVYLVVVK